MAEVTTTDIPAENIRIAQATIATGKINKPKTKKANRQIIGPSRERVIVYDEKLTWQASMPTEELMRNLPIKARYVPDIDQERYIGMAIFSFGFFFLIFLFFLKLFYGINTGIITVFSAALALPPGLIAGWFWGPKIGRKPFWVIRRKYNPETEQCEIEPICHTYLLGDPNSFRDPDNPMPGIFLGTSWYNNVEARGVRRFFTASLSSTMQKIQLTAIVIIAVCLVIVVFMLLAMANG